MKHWHFHLTYSGCVVFAKQCYKVDEGESRWPGVTQPGLKKIRDAFNTSQSINFSKDF